MNSWCPICTSGINERVCREYFKIIFQQEFPKKKPKWLISEIGNRMELDGYNEEMQLAFEYHGEQHYNPIPYFYEKQNKSFEKRVMRDKLKENICQKHDVTLIVIPHTVSPENIQQFIIKECKNNGVIIPDKIDFVDFRNLNVYSPEKLLAMQKRNLMKLNRAQKLNSDFLQNKL